MARSFGRRIGALAAVLLAGMAILVSAGPASAQSPGYRFQSDCSGSSTGGSVDVPAGTNVPGMGVVGATTTITATNVTVTFPSGNTAILNEVTTVGGTTTRNAVRFLTGPNAGIIIGQVTCNAESGATATALISAVGVRQIFVNCPLVATVAPAGGTATAGNVTVGYPAGARCTSPGVPIPGAATDGFYDVNPYPLAVDVSEAAVVAPAVASPASDDGGPAGSVLLIAGAAALGLAVLAQVAIGRRMSQRRGDATS